MKSYRTLLFILGLAMGLFLMAAIFPREGAYINNILFRFPSLSEVFGQEPEPLEEEEEEPEAVQLSPEELMEQRLATLHAARDSEFVAYIAKSPTRFYMPDDDVAYLDPFFQAMDNAAQHPTRIMHYGDSQLEGDRMTGVLREYFQSTFGGNGPGMAPAMQTLGSATVTVTTTPELPHYMYFGSSAFHADHKRYGPLAQMVEVTDSATFDVKAHGGSLYPHCRSFRRVGVMLSGAGSLAIPLSEGDTLELRSSLDSTFHGLRIASATLPSSVSRATIKARGNMEIYGLMLDGTGGVSMDNIAMRGVSGTLFTSIERQTLAPFFTQQNVSLIILQYGGNSVPYLRDSRGISNYKRQLMAQISLFRQMSPASRILFIGPSDMATADGEEMKTYPRLPEIVDSLRAAAVESGAAFWNMYRAMGGRGSMVRWVEADPQLAGEDYIHFTPRGSRKMAELLSQTFDFYYKYYRFRNHLDAETLPEDSASNDTTLPLHTLHQPPVR
ncbi:MAG: hypothetical protein K5945_09000 [Bacteroidaceae bacterium]|nr:hypothetical protein [Bacteroidaceae bacterium]